MVVEDITRDLIRQEAEKQVAAANPFSLPEIPINLSDAIPFVGVGVFVLVLIIAVAWFVKNQFFSRDRKFIDELFKKDVEELKAYKLSKGLGKLIALMAFLLFSFALAKWLFNDDLLGMTVVLIMGYSTGQFLVTALGRFIVRENKVITGDMTIFGILESSPMRKEDGFEYYLVRRGNNMVFFAKYCILKIPIKKSYNYRVFDKKKKEFIKATMKLKMDPLTMFKRTDNYDLIINAVGFEKHGNYYYPIYKDKKNHDLFSFKNVAFSSTYKNAKDIAIYDIAQEQLNNSMIALSGNPHLGIARRSQGQSVSAGDEKS